MNKKDIHGICTHYGIKNYTINDDMSIDVNGDVIIYKKCFNELPLKFRNIKGTFYCHDNLLTSLLGSPIKISGSFDCSLNKLTSFEYAPIEVGGYFYARHNPITNLTGIPLNIKEKDFYLPGGYTYDDYLEYCKVVERDLKFKKILK